MVMSLGGTSPKQIFWVVIARTLVIHVQIFSLINGHSSIWVIGITQNLGQF